MNPRALGLISHFMFSRISCSYYFCSNSFEIFFASDMLPASPSSNRTKHSEFLMFFLFFLFPILPILIHSMHVSNLLYSGSCFSSSSFGISVICLTFFQWNHPHWYLGLSMICPMKIMNVCVVLYWRPEILRKVIKFSL
jgi:hypothetical protein